MIFKERNLFCEIIVCKTSIFLLYFLKSRLTAFYLLEMLFELKPEELFKLSTSKILLNNLGVVDCKAIYGPLLILQTEAYNFLVFAICTQQLFFNN